MLAVTCSTPRQLEVCACCSRRPECHKNALSFTSLGFISHGSSICSLAYLLPTEEGSLQLTCSNTFTWAFHGALSQTATTAVADAPPYEQEARLQSLDHHVEFLLLIAWPRTQDQKKKKKLWCPRNWPHFRRELAVMPSVVLTTHLQTQ